MGEPRHPGRRRLAQRLHVSADPRAADRRRDRRRPLRPLHWGHPPRAATESRPASSGAQRPSRRPAAWPRHPGALSGTRGSWAPPGATQRSSRRLPTGRAGAVHVPVPPGPRSCQKGHHRELRSGTRPSEIANTCPQAKTIITTSQPPHRRHPYRAAFIRSHDGDAAVVVQAGQRIQRLVQQEGTPVPPRPAQCAPKALLRIVVASMSGFSSESHMAIMVRFAGSRLHLTNACWSTPLRSLNR